MKPLSNTTTSSRGEEDQAGAETKLSLLQERVAQTRTSLGVFSRIEGELQAMRKGQRSDASETRIAEMIRLNREVADILRRKLERLETDAS